MINNLTDKKFIIQLISLYEILVNLLVFTLFVYGMDKNIIRPAFGIFVAGPSLIFAFSAIGSLTLLNDQKYLLEHKYYIHHSGVKFVFGVINMISCINGETKTMYWINNQFITESFFIYFISCIPLFFISKYLIKKEEELHNNNKQIIKDIINELVDNVASDKPQHFNIDV